MLFSSSSGAWVYVALGGSKLSKCVEVFGKIINNEIVTVPHYELEKKGRETTSKTAFHPAQQRK